VRQAYLDANPGPEPTFAAVVADLDAAWLVDSSLPVPVRDTQVPVSAAVTGNDGPAHRPAAAETDTDAGPEVSRPPAGEDSGPTPAEASPRTSGPVSSEDGEPVQDEPDAEPDCAEGADA
jgi:hypothetical protein